jgi:hypothetical protein
LDTIRLGLLRLAAHDKSMYFRILAAVIQEEGEIQCIPMRAQSEYLMNAREWTEVYVDIVGRAEQAMVIAMHIECFTSARFCQRDR